MHIILLAHTHVKKYTPPDSDPYERYQIKLNKLASALWQEWCDISLFCNYVKNIRKTDAGFGKKSSRGEGSGDRVLYTEERPAFLAKNRWGLPPEIYIGKDKTWGAFHAALQEATAGRYVAPGQASHNADQPILNDNTNDQHATQQQPDQYQAQNPVPGWAVEDDIPFSLQRVTN
jgi:hypothetical protein